MLTLQHEPGKRSEWNLENRAWLKDKRVKFVNVPQTGRLKQFYSELENEEGRVLGSAFLERGFNKYM